MKKYIVPISWTMTGTIEVIADSLDSAKERALDEFYGMAGYPQDQQYVLDSGQIDAEDENIKEKEF
jgi:hypothetical protein